MSRLCLIDRANSVGVTGPHNVVYAFTEAIHLVGDNRVTVTRARQVTDIMWAATTAVGRALRAYPRFIVGPAFLFADRAHPNKTIEEQYVTSSKRCRAIITETRAYAELIAQNKVNDCPIIEIPCPIWPIPCWEYNNQTCDLLVYCKIFHSTPAVAELLRCIERDFPQARYVHYGQYRREELLAMARTSRVCLYLSTEDRGPLALAEILLTGCPVIGIQRTAPWVIPDCNGAHISDWDYTEFRVAYERCLALKREHIYLGAMTRFDARNVLRYLLTELTRYGVINGTTT